ncbi:hypothetical protein IJT17_00150 [bacterium]|nr:hypothetical protein [bacterium]
MVSQTKKGYLSELESALDLKDFKLQGNFGEAKVTALWKDVPFSIVAFPQFTTKPSDISYSMPYRFGFTAKIAAGPGLNADPAAAKKKSDDEEELRPWRVRLTAEEQKIIDARRGDTGEATEMPMDKFTITANRADGVTKFLKNEEHSKAAEELLKAGISEIQINMEEIVAIKHGYDNNDMMPKQVETYLKALKSLVS